MPLDIPIYPYPDDAAFEAILRFALSRADRIRMVKTEYEGPNDNSRLTAFERLEPYLSSVEIVRDIPGWPTIKIHKGHYLYPANEVTLSILLDWTCSVEVWMGPGAVEDLCLLRPDGTELFGTISHEMMAWLRVEESELAEVDRLFTFERVIVGARGEPTPLVAPRRS